MTSLRGFAVVDTETTGIRPGFRHRIAEIAVVHVDFSGEVTGEWSTLVNPDRDLGPQAIHGIRAAEVRRAPKFEQFAGDLLELFRGRVPVAHNLPFDAMHLRAEFARLDVDLSRYLSGGVCTMRFAGDVFPGMRRSLAECCKAVGVDGVRFHTALGDALATAQLFGRLVEGAPELASFRLRGLPDVHGDLPSMPQGLVKPVHRQAAGHAGSHFLARLVDRVPRERKPEVDAYLAVLDRALLDRQISASEADALIDVAHDLGLHKAEVIQLHHGYLRSLAQAAWADGHVAVGERRDLEAVAALLGLDADEVDLVLREEQSTRVERPRSQVVEVSIGGLVLRPGDRIVLTGTMRRHRSELTAEALALGLQVISSVSRKTRVVAAADPDSLSGKAKDARALGVPVVTEDAFVRALDAMKR
ncbi:exonuclease domain-containing protein [Amycolatopsis coloradensis]|uniref:Exonuclease domain-containing protein n=1 Tax=Amycolatopsis coloradensis TaxID=76021 RepID=A0ACD5BJD7_9PSEU